MPSDREVIEFLRVGLGRGIPAQQLRATLKRAGVTLPEEPLRMDVPAGPETAAPSLAPVPRDIAGLAVEEQREPKFAERAMMGAIRAAPVVAGTALGGAAIGGGVARQLLGRSAGAAAGSALSDIMARERPSGTAAATSGVANLLLEGVPTAVGFGSARAARVPKEALQRTLAKSQGGRLRDIFSDLPVEAEFEQAKEAARAAGAAVIRKSAGRIRAERMIKQFDNVSGLPLDPRGVDFRPIKQRMLSLIDKRATSTERIRVNESMEALAGRLPDFGTMDDLDFFIREHTAPIKGALANVDAPVPAEFRKRIVSFARAERNRLLPEAKEAFTKASNHIARLKNFRNMIVDTKGNIKQGATGRWRSIMSDAKTREIFQRFDQETGNNFFERALDLATKRAWSPDDGDTAAAGLQAVVGWLGRATLFGGRAIAKTAIVGARPAGMIGSVTAGAVARPEAEANP